MLLYIYLDKPCTVGHKRKPMFKGNKSIVIFPTAVSSHMHLSGDSCMHILETSVLEPYEPYESVLE